MFAAISDDRVAAIERPHVERFRLRMTSATMPMTISMNIANVLSLVRSKGPMIGTRDRPARLHVAQPVPLEQDLVAEERERERRQREWQAAQPERWERDHDAEQDGDPDADQHRREEAPLVPVDRAFPW